MTRASDFDVIVIGLGAMGSATAYQLARRGARACGIDRFDPPHERGSSHGHPRITRLAVGEGPEYVPLVKRSHAIWRELEAQAGEVLMLQNGGLVLGPADGRSQMHGQQDFVSRSIEMALRFGITHEVLDARGIAARFEQFVLTGNERAYFEPEAGLLYPERCVAVQLAAARRLGAQIVTGQAVTGLAAEGASVVVTTPDGRWRAAQAVLCTGAWGPALAGGRFAQHFVAGCGALHLLRPGRYELFDSWLRRATPRPATPRTSRMCLCTQWAWFESCPKGPGLSSASPETARWTMARSRQPHC